MTISFRRRRGAAASGTTSTSTRREQISKKKEAHSHLHHLSRSTTSILVVLILTLLLLPPFLSMLGIEEALLNRNVDKIPTKPLFRSAQDIILLNETTSLTNSLKKNKNNEQDEPKIDILVIGSKHQLHKPKVQKETWASHPSCRHFFLATEYDDHDPQCDEHYTIDDLQNEVQTCKRKGLDISPGASTSLKKAFQNKFARMQWLLKRKSPAGWFCALRRPSIGLAKLARLYRQTALRTSPNPNSGRGNGNYDLPDYLFIGDDDSYVNLDHVSEMLINQPQRLERLQGISSQEHSIIPTHDTPVVWAGCRVRWPVHQVNFTFGYGGFGYFFSKSSLQRLIKPLHCSTTSSTTATTTTTTTAQEGMEINNDDNNDPLITSYVKHACDRLTEPGNALIGEDRFFSSGMSLIDVWGAMTEMDPFCMHADWIYGYFVNYYNISRHTVHTNGMNWFDDRFGNLPESRLHGLTADSEVYKKTTGYCKYDDKCEQNATLCHHINEVDMRQIHNSYLSMKKNK